MSGKITIRQCPRCGKAMLFEHDGVCKRCFDEKKLFAEFEKTLDELVTSSRRLLETMKENNGTLTTEATEIHKA